MAVDRYRRAARASPGTILGQIAQSRALIGEDRFAEAAEVLESIIRQNSSQVEARYLHANCMTALGRFDHAWVQYEQILRISPESLRCYYHMVRLRRITPADMPLLDRLASDSVRVPVGEMRALVQLALGKAFDDLGDYQRAMHQFDLAGENRRRSGTLDRQGLAAAFDWLMRQNPPTGMRSADAERRHRVPMFVLGMPRSGTTLVEQILSSHRDVTGAGELPFWNDCGTRLVAAKPEGPLDRFVTESADSYLRYLDGVAPDAKRVVDKMPSNFVWAGLIHAALPESPIIHCRRHPIDVCLSIYGTYFFSKTPFMPVTKDDLVFFYKQYLRLMRRWRQVLSPVQFTELRYKLLVSDTEPEVRRLLAHCGLEWDANCLAPERNPRAVRTASMWQVRQPIYRHATERWKRYEPWLGELNELADLVD